MSVAYLPKSFIHHYYHGVRVFEKLKDQSFNAQNVMSDEMANSLFETYKIMPCHRIHIYFKEHITWRWQKTFHIHYLLIRS